MTPGIPLREAAMSCAATDDEAGFWQTANFMFEDDALNDSDLKRLVEIDRRITAAVLDKLRSGEWCASGVQPGETVVTSPPAEWWHRPIDIKIWKDAAEWNGVRLNGIMVAGVPTTGAKPAPVAPRSNPRKHEAKINQWMEALAVKHKHDTGFKLTRTAGIRACRPATGASHRQANQAYRSLPTDLKLSRGERISKSRDA